MRLYIRDVRQGQLFKLRVWNNKFGHIYDDYLEGRYFASGSFEKRRNWSQWWSRFTSILFAQRHYFPRLSPAKVIFFTHLHLFLTSSNNCRSWMLECAFSIWSTPRMNTNLLGNPSSDGSLYNDTGFLHTLVLFTREESAEVSLQFQYSPLYQRVLQLVQLVSQPLFHKQLKYYCIVWWKFWANNT